MNTHKIIMLAISLLLGTSIAIPAATALISTNASTKYDASTENATEEVQESSCDSTAAVLPESTAVVVEQTTQETTAEAVAETIPEETQAPTPVTEVPVTEAPPDAYQISDAPSTAFNNSLFIGDSRTVGIAKFSNLGSATVFAEVGINIFRIFKDTINVYGVGSTNLDNLLSERQFDKIYIMLGINEMGYDHEYLDQKFGEAISRISALQPNARIFIQANLRIVKSRSDTDSIFNNASINDLNARFSAHANGQNIFFIDPNPLFDDGSGNLSAAYSSDDFHLKAKYYAQWASWIAENAG